MLSDVDVRQLVEYESHEHPVLSVYLNVDPQQRTVEQYKLALRNLLDGGKDASPEDVKRVQNYVEMGYNRQSRGLVMFSCMAGDFWWAQGLQTPVADSAVISFRPYVRQLATLMDTYVRYGIVHVDQEITRLYLFHLGHLEAAEGYMGEEIKPHRSGGWAAQRYQRREAGYARQNMQDAAEMAEDFFRQTATHHLILAGTDKNVAAFRELFSHRLRGMVVGQISAKATATPAELREKALEIVNSVATAEANTLVEQVFALTQTGGNAVLGLTETLTAVQNGRAAHVVVLNDYVQSAYRFVDSGHILLDLNEQSDLQSGRVQPLPDAVESVIRRAMLQGIGVTILNGHAGLAKAGKIGALTRY